LVRAVTGTSSQQSITDTKWTNGTRTIDLARPGGQIKESQTEQLIASMLGA